MDEITRPDYVSPENNQSNSMVNNSGDSEETKAPEKKKSKKRLAIIAGLAGAALAASSFIGIHLANHAPDSEPGNSASSNPNKTLTPGASAESEIPSVEELEIPSNLSDEELGRVTFDRLNAWINAGSNNKTVYKESLNQSANNVDLIDFTTEKAKEYATVFSKALFIHEWENDATLKQAYDGFIKINAKNLANNIVTKKPVPENAQAWFSIWDVENVQSVSLDKIDRVIKITVKEKDNADKNSIPDENSVNNNPLGHAYYTISFTKVDDRLLISKIDVAIVK